MYINEIKFSTQKKQKFGTIIWESDKYILKLQDWYCHDKRHALPEEVEIIQELNKLGAVCVPKILDTGTHKEKPYYIAEKVNKKSGIKNADALLAFLELKGLGFIHGDLYRDRYFPWKQGNVLFNRLHCILIDFDQAIRDRQVNKMKLDELFIYMDETYPKWSANCGSLKKQLERFRYWKYFKNGRLDLSATTLMKKGVSTDYGQGIYHSIDGDNVFINGERGLDERLKILEKIDFAGEEVLDVGCNTGLLTRYIVRRNAKSVDGVEYCREHAIAGQIINHCEGISNSNIQWHDLGVRPITKSYDTILLFSVLHHIKNMDFAIEQVKHNCRRILLECRLKEDGYQFVKNKWIKTNSWNYGDFDTLIQAFERLFDFSFSRDYGSVDRERKILEFIKR